MFTPVFLEVLSNEFMCAELLRQILWAEGVYCPHCGSKEVIRWGWYHQVFRRYKCKSCVSYFNDKTGTPFHYSRLSLRAWFFLILQFVVLHSSVNALARLYDVSYETCFLAFKRTQLRILNRGHEEGRLAGVVEIDEAYQTAGLKGKNNSDLIKELGRRPRRRGLKHRGRGTYEQDKPPIFCLVQRGGERRLLATRDVKKDTVHRILKAHVEEGSLIYHDEYGSYSGLEDLGYEHESVCHSRGEYARGKVHVNTCEGEFSVYRPWMNVHRGVAKYNLPLDVSLYQLHRRLMNFRGMESVNKALEAVILILTIHQQHSQIRAFAFCLSPIHIFAKDGPPAHWKVLEVRTTTDSITWTEKTKGEITVFQGPVTLVLHLGDQAQFKTAGFSSGVILFFSSIHHRNVSRYDNQKRTKALCLFNVLILDG